MALEKLTIPAYVTVAFTIEPTPRVKIQELTEREVVFDDGAPLGEGKLLPPRLILAPLENDVITATLEEALGPIGAAAVAAIADADAAKAAAEARLEALGGDVVGRLEKRVAQLEAEVTAKDANIQALLAAAAEGGGQ